MTPLSFRIAQTLLLIGLCILLQSITEKIKNYHRDDRPLVDMKIRSMGLIIKMPREPGRAELDFSGRINPKAILPRTFFPTTPKCPVGVSFFFHEVGRMCVNDLKVEMPGKTHRLVKWLIYSALFI